MNSLRKVSLLVSLVVLLSGCQRLSLGHPGSAADSQLPQTPAGVGADHQLSSIKIGDQVLTVEVVSTPAGITQGLSDRSELGADGMLFILPQPAATQFWMKNMQFSLDIVWISQGQVIGVAANVPHPSPGTPESQLPLYPSPGVVDMVLELPAGQAQALGIMPGVKLSLQP